MKKTKDELQKKGLVLAHPTVKLSFTSPTGKSSDGKFTSSAGKSMEAASEDADEKGKLRKFFNSAKKQGMDVI
jgi:hypothetical protein